jgi:hypothetical protein
MNKHTNVKGSQEAPWVAWLSAQRRPHMSDVLEAFQVSWLCADEGYPAEAEDGVHTPLMEAGI